MGGFFGPIWLEGGLTYGIGSGVVKLIANGHAAPDKVFPNNRVLIYREFMKGGFKVS